MESKEKIEFSKKALYSFLIKKRRNIPFNKLTYLDSGAYADAFRCGDRVFKVTVSYEDFRMAQGVKNGDFKSFTTCYSLDAIEFEGEKLFIIETKYEGKTIGDLFSEDSIDFIICDFLCDWFCYGFHNTEITEEEDLTLAYTELFNDNQDKFLSSSELFKSSEMVRQLFVRFYLFYKTLFVEFSQLGGLVFDYHVYNICYSDERLKVIDFGGGREIAGVITEEIKFIKVKYPKYQSLKNLLQLNHLRFIKNYITLKG